MTLQERPNSVEARDIRSVIHGGTNLKRHAERGPLVIDRGECVWVTDVHGRLWRIDPETAATVFTTPAAAGPFSICSSGSALWAADNGDGRVLRIDPENGRVSAAVEIGHAPTDVAVGLDATWVTVQGDRAI